MAGDSKSKKKKDDKSEKSKSKSKSKEKDSKSASKKEKSKKDKDKQSKSKKKSQIKNIEGQSDVSSILPTPPPPADCIHHKSPFIYYCQTCEQLICNQCTVYGPHNNHLHRILKITDAYRSRVFYLSEAIRANLVDKRDKIIAQLHRLEYRSEEIRFVKNIIGRDVRSEYGGILERLRNQEGVKLANLSHEMSLAQRQIDTINQIGNSFFDLTSFQNCSSAEQERKLCKFLLKSKHMYEAIQYLLNKPDRPLPETKPQELPRQIEENRTLIQKALAAKQINQFKNEVVWNLVNDVKEQEQVVKAEVDKKADTMVSQLGEQAERLNQRLLSFKLICAFCGQRLTSENINQECQANQTKQLQNQLYQTEKAPTKDFYGNSRHFFSRPLH